MATQSTVDRESAARIALTNSPIFALREIHVSHKGEHLVLTGRVPSFYYKQLAQEAVRAVVDDIPVLNVVDVD